MHCTHNLSTWRLRVTIVATERQHLVLSVLLSYSSLSTIYVLILIVAQQCSFHGTSSPTTVKCKLPDTFCPILTEFGFFGRYSRKSYNIKFEASPSSGSRADVGGEIDGRTDMTKLIGAFRDYDDAPKCRCFIDSERHCAWFYIPRVTVGAKTNSYAIGAEPPVSIVIISGRGSGGSVNTFHLITATWNLATVSRT
jgi:hypothetical protein